MKALIYKLRTRLAWILHPDEIIAVVPKTKKRDRK